MDKSPTIPLIVCIAFSCLTFALWLGPSQAQNGGAATVPKKMSDADQAAAAMDAFAEMGSGIVSSVPQDDADLDVEASTSSIKGVVSPELLKNTTQDQPLTPPVAPAHANANQSTQAGQSAVLGSTPQQQSNSPDNSESAAASNNDAVRALLVPKREVSITSLAVDSVVAVNVDEGDRVKAGQVLVEFACKEPRASMKVAKSRVAQYKMIHEANQELYAEDAITELDLELSSAKVDEGLGEVALATAQLQRCQVKAPYNGIAVAVTVSDFANVQIGEPLLTIMDNSNIELILNVPSLWLRSRENLVHRVFEVTVEETGKTYRAVVDRIGSVIDPSSRTVQLTAVIPGDNLDLVPGMSGNAALFANEQ